MARSESDREDLLREATALVERAELRIEGYDEPMVVGFRRDGEASVFFGADPVYQFNAAGELRRAYVGGRLYKAEQGRLVALSRERSAAQVALIRTELTDDETAALVEALQLHLSRVRTALRDRSYQVLGQVPREADLAGRIGAWLDWLPAALRIARVPNVR